MVAMRKTNRYPWLGMVAMCLFVLIPPVPAFGAHPLITDDTGTQGRGKTQIELTGQYDRDNEDGVKTRDWEAKVTVSYGLFDPLDVILEVPYDWKMTKDAAGTMRNDGVADMSIAAKWRFFECQGLSFALKPSVTLPTGDENKGLGNGRASYGITSITTYANDPWAFHINVGFMHNDYKRPIDRDANRSEIWNASLAAEVQVMKRVRLVGDVGLERNSDVTSNTPPAFSLVGAIYSLTEAIDLDVGIKWGLTGPEPDVSFLTGLTFRF